MEYLETVESFIEWLKQNNKSISTIKSYKNCASRFIKHCNSEGIDLLNYLESDVLGYLESELHRGVSRATILKTANGINNFSLFIKNPTEVTMNNIKFKQDLEDTLSAIVVLSNETQMKMYSYASKVWKKRNACIMLLILETGIKLNELISLNKSNIFKINDNYYVKVNSDITRTLPISDVLYSHIQEMLSKRKDCIEALFISNYKERISERTVIHSIALHGNLTSIILRDTYITNLLKNDTDTYTISQLAGLKSYDAFIKKYYARDYIETDNFYELTN